MPATAKQYGVNVFDEESSINGMIKYMSVLIKQFDGDIDKAVMAYNAGPKMSKLAEHMDLKRLRIICLMLSLMLLGLMGLLDLLKILKNTFKSNQSQLQIA